MLHDKILWKHTDIYKCKRRPKKLKQLKWGSSIMNMNKNIIYLMFGGIYVKMYSI